MVLEGWLDTAAIGELALKLAKLNKIAKNLGLRPLTFAFGEKRTSESWLERIKKSKQVDGLNLEHEPQEIFVRIEGETPKVNGWEFIGSIEPVASDDGKIVNVVRSAPGHEIPRDLWEGWQGRCDHCNSIRKRTKTFVLKSVETNEIKIVGRNCLANFIRSDDLAAHIDFYWLAGKLLEPDRPIEEYYKKRMPEIWTFSEVVEASDFITKTRGYGGKTAKIPTSTWVDKLTSPTRIHKGEPDAKIVALKEEFAAFRESQTLKIDWLAWIREQAEKPNSTSFEHNAFAISLKPAITWRDFGIVCAIPFSYYKSKGEIGEKPTAKTYDQPAWKVGDIVTITAKVLSAGSFVNDWGTTTYIYSLESENRLIKMFTSKGFDDGAEIILVDAVIQKIGVDNYSKGQIVTTVKTRKIRQ